MSTAFPTSSRIVWGVRELKPVVGAPEGAQRIKLRNRSVAMLFVRTADGVRQFSLKEEGDNWTPAFEVSRNFRPQGKAVTA